MVLELSKEMSKHNKLLEKAMERTDKMIQKVDRLENKMMQKEIFNYSNIQEAIEMKKE